MKTRALTLSKILLGVCTVLVFKAPAAFAQPPPGVYYAPAYTTYSPYFSHSVNGLGFYLAGDAGISIMQDFNSSRFGFPGRFSSDPGARLSIEPGFDFVAIPQLTLGAEFETGFIYNHVTSITQAGASTGLDGDYYQVPILVNLVLKLFPNCPVTPYLGAGGGGLYSDAHIHPIGGFDGWVHDDEVDWAVQAMAGIRWKLNPAAELGFGYKFIAALPGGGNNVYTHAVLASFSLNF